MKNILKIIVFTLNGEIMIAQLIGFESTLSKLVWMVGTHLNCQVMATINISLLSAIFNNGCYLNYF